MKTDIIPTAEKTRNGSNTSNALEKRLQQIADLIVVSSSVGEKEVWVDILNTKIDSQVEKILKDKGYFVDVFDTRHTHSMCIQWRKKYRNPVC